MVIERESIMTIRFGPLLLIITITASIAINLIYLFSQSIRLDESQSIWVATKSIPAILRIDAQDVNAPLYTLMLHFWLQLFGTDIVMARLLSFVFFIATLPCLYLLIRDVANRATAIVGVALFSLSPFVIWYSQEARTYTLLTLLATLSHYFFLHFLHSRGITHKLGYLIVSVLGMYTHYFFTFLLITQLFFLIHFYFKNRQQRHFLPPSYRRLSKNYVFVMALLLLIYAPWVFYVMQLGVAAYTQPLITQPTSFNLLQIYLNFLVGFQHQTIQSLVISVWPLFLMVLFFVFTKKLKISMARVDYFLVVSFLPVLLVYLLSFYRPIFLPRYLIFVVPSLFTLLAWILINFGKRFMSVLVIGTLILMLLSLNFQNRSLLTPVKEDYRDTVSYIQAYATPQDIVAVTAPFTIYPIEYYYSGLARLDTIPSWNRYLQGPIPSFSLSALEQQIQQYALVYNRLFVILSYDQGYEASVIDYLDHHYERLNSIDYPAAINVRVYKLRYDTQTVQSTTSSP